MSVSDDRKQLQQNLYALLADLGETAQLTLKFAKAAMEAPPDQLVRNGPQAAIATLGVEALRAGTDAVLAVQKVGKWVIVQGMVIESEESRNGDGKGNS